MVQKRNTKNATEPSVLIEITKISSTHHILRCTREDGSVHEAELESKTYLIHDFTHLAYEQTAGLTDSFWGSLAKGKPFDELRKENDPTTVHPDNNEITQTEMIVGPLQGIMQGKRQPEELIEGLTNLFNAYNTTIPEHLTVDLINQTQTVFKTYLGEYNSLEIGEKMVIEW